MREILDEEIVERSINEYTEKAYAKFKVAAIFFILGFLLTFLANVLGIPTYASEIVLLVFILLAVVYSVIAVFPAMRSFALKEEETFKKWISIVGPLFIIAIFISMIVMNIIDMMKTFY